MEWNAENVLDALNDFERKQEFNPVLEEYLQRIAQNGEIVFPWCKLKPLLKKKLEIVLDELNEVCPVETTASVPNFETFNFDNLKKSILQSVEAFASAPFTIQRLCELVTNPQKHYNRTDKYMRGIEKNVLVVSTIEPRTGSLGDGNANNPIVNGMISDSPQDGDGLNGEHHENSDVSSTDMATHANHVLLENFENVFPSAACIPSASNICIKQDSDANFMPSSEFEDAKEEEFEVTSEQLDSDSKEKDEEEFMDTGDDVASSSDEDGTKSEGTAATSVESSKCSDAVSESNGIDEADKTSDNEELSDVSVELDSDQYDGTASEDSKSEADCSQELLETSPAEDALPDKEEPIVQQDDTVSQSDDSKVEDASQSKNECIKKDSILMTSDLSENLCDTRDQQMESDIPKPEELSVGLFI